MSADKADKVDTSDAPSGIPVHDAQQKSTRAKAPSSRRTILIAEDDPGVRKLVVRVLETAGYDILVAVDGQEAIDLFDAHGSDIALALMDVMMPTLNGWQACTHMRRTNPHLPVIFATGYCPEIISVALRDARNTVLLKKPFSPSALLERIRASLMLSKVRSTPIGEVRPEPTIGGKSERDLNV